jgi:hypothetical protein
MRSLLIASSLAACVLVGGLAQSQQKSDPSRDSQLLLKRCSKEDPPPCVDKAPIPVYSPDPNCSQDAEKAEIKGETAFRAVVGIDGIPHDISVVKHLGHELDEEVVKAASVCRNFPGA